MFKIIISVVSHGHKDLVADLISSLDQYLNCENCDIRIVVTENRNEYHHISSKKFPCL